MFYKGQLCSCISGVSPDRVLRVKLVSPLLVGRRRYIDQLMPRGISLLQVRSSIYYYVIQKLLSIVTKIVWSEKYPVLIRASTEKKVNCRSARNLINGEKRLMCLINVLTTKLTSRPGIGITLYLFQPQ